MIEELSIRNFAIIDDLSIRFAPGLTILSGETGAGKSILINAVNLLLGSRANATLIRTGSDEAELEALFKISTDSGMARLMTEQGYDPDEGLMVRRIISRKGNNRIYINGRLATMQLLSMLTENLASISGQHAHQGLLKEEQHLLILDQFGGLLPLRSEYGEQFRALLPMLEELDALQSKQARQSEQTELILFQKKEIEDAAIRLGEDADIELEQVRLKHAEQLHQVCFDAIEEIYGRQGSVIERLEEIKKQLVTAGRIDESLVQKGESLAETTYGLEDLVGDLRAYLTKIDMDSGRLEIVEERLDLLNRLKRKYGGALETVQAHLEEIDRELYDIENLTEKIQETEKQITVQHVCLTDLAERLSAKRASAASDLSQKVVAELDGLKMEQTAFEVDLQHPTSDAGTPACLKAGTRLLTESGIDRASFLIAPNVGETLKPLANIASGGELSRVVLAIKAILAETEAVETIIFDEVDAGIGGGVAEKVGEKLKELSRHHQIICITHLPQIAKFGQHHYRISKSVVADRTRTVIEALDEESRLNEIARMLGGIDITATTLAHARELLKEAG